MAKIPQTKLKDKHITGKKIIANVQPTKLLFNIQRTLLGY